MNDADGITNDPQPHLQALVTAPEQERPILKPKGACWYCNAPLDNVRRFCNKECAQDYRIEEESFR